MTDSPSYRIPLPTDAPQERKPGPGLSDRGRAAAWVVAWSGWLVAMALHIAHPDQSGLAAICTFWSGFGTAAAIFAPSRAQP